MSEDEENIRHYMPVLRRITIVLAVLIAVPVVMWTITAYVRGYVGRPSLPTFRRLAEASIAPTKTDVAPAPTANDTAANPNATPVHTVVIAPGAPGSADPPGAAATGQPASIAPAATNTANGAAVPPAGAVPVITPDPQQIAAQQPPAAAAWPPVAVVPVAAMPEATPIAEPVPLPRKRPRVFALSRTPIPLPRPRPEVADATQPQQLQPQQTSHPASSPLEWLQNVLPHSASFTPAVDDTSNTTVNRENFDH